MKIDTFTKVHFIMAFIMAFESKTLIDVSKICSLWYVPVYLGTRDFSTVNIFLESNQNLGHTTFRYLHTNI